jgi:hypothetical protein
MLIHNHLFYSLIDFLAGECLSGKRVQARKRERRGERLYALIPELHENAHSRCGHATAELQFLSTAALPGY